jgi:phosphocarrier protein
LYSKTIRVKNPTGLHARPAADFVAAAMKFNSNITLRRTGDDELFNAKSIVMLLALGLGKDEEAVLSAEGSDERDAVETLNSLIESFTE